MKAAWILILIATGGNGTSQATFADKVSCESALKAAIAVGGFAGRTKDNNGVFYAGDRITGTCQPYDISKE